MQASLSIMPASRVLDTLVWPNHDGAATDCGSRAMDIVVWLRSLGLGKL